jgi:hypothetical protein
MAYLIERSGRRDIVDRISGTQNLAYIRDLESDTGLVAWIEASGIEVAEAARIQPAYRTERRQEATLAATAATVGLSGISLFTAHANVFRPSEVQGFVGILIGSATVLVGVVTSHDYPVLTGINAVSGGLAILTGIYAAFRPRDSVARERAQRPRGATNWTPLTQWSPQTGARAGLLVSF